MRSFMLVFVLLLGLPRIGQAELIYRTATGTVTGFSGNQILFKGPNAVTYAADPATAVLTRRNGAPMLQSEILVGDKIEATGIPWSDSSMTAKSIRNLSLYTHPGTFSGKISALDPLHASFTIQSRANGTQYVQTDPVTSFKKGSKNSTFNNLELGHTATIKGVWDRSKSNISARTVRTTVRLVNIDITGELRLKTDTGLTIIADHVIYGVDITKAKLQNKKGKPIILDAFQLGDTIKISGKHVAEFTQITGSIAKDLSIIK